MWALKIVRISRHDWICVHAVVNVGSEKREEMRKFWNDSNEYLRKTERRVVLIEDVNGKHRSSETLDVLGK